MSTGATGDATSTGIILPEAPGRPPRLGSGKPVDESTESARPASALGLFAALAAAALPVVADPQVGSDTFTPKYFVMLIIAAVGVVPLYRLARSGPLRVPARFGVSFLLVAFVAALSSAVPVEGLFGTYLWGTGWFFWLACVGGWAIGATLDEHGRVLLIRGLLGGVLANALLGIIQVYGTKLDPGLFTAGLLATFNGQADGFLGNPIHLEALLMGGLALVLGRACRRPWPWALWTAIIALALEMSAERLAPILFIGLVAYALWRYPWRRVLIYAGSIAVGYVVGDRTGTLSVVNRATTLATARTTDGLRLGIWKVALKADLHRPLLGYGPGQFSHATSATIPASLAAQLGPDRYFTDAHDILIEVLTTTGVLGLLAIAGLVATSVRSARGALLGFAAFTLAVRLIEPLNVGTDPLAFMAIGGVAGTFAWDRSRQLEPGNIASRMVTAVCVLAAVLLGSSLLIGDAFLYEGALHYSVPDAQTASRLLPEWPESASDLARVYAYNSIVHPGQGWLLKARAAELAALGREPTSPGYWADLGNADLDLGHVSLAIHDFDRSLNLAPYDDEALTGLATIAISRHQYETAFTEEQLAYSLYPTTREQTELRQIEADLHH